MTYELEENIEKLGMTETTEMIDFIMELAYSIKLSMEDNEATLSDLFNFSRPLSCFVDALKGSSSILDELDDMSSEEYETLLQFISKKEIFKEEELEYTFDVMLSLGKALLELYEALETRQ